AIYQGAWICNCIFSYIHPATIEDYEKCKTERSEANNSDLLSRRLLMSKYVTKHPLTHGYYVIHLSFVTIGFNPHLKKHNLLILTREISMKISSINPESFFF